jgi:hypothetical protein
MAAVLGFLTAGGVEQRDGVLSSSYEVVMLITPDQPHRADRALRAGQLACPGECQGRLRPWGWARRRPIRHADRVQVVRPRRARCAGCGITHVLLPASMLAHRAWAISVIGPALTLAADGHSHRRIAGRLGVPADTVRGWLRRLRARADLLVAWCTATAYRLDASLGRLEPARGWRSALHAAVGLIGVAAAAFVRHLAVPLSPWQAVCAVTSGLLLANTNRPFTPPS